MINLFINILLLISALSIGSQVFREKSLAMSKSFLSRVLSGLLLGVLGCILMIFNMNFGSDVIMDLRCIAIIIASIYSGFIPTMIAGTIIGFFRVAYFGFSGSSLVALFTILAISVGCGIVGRKTVSNKNKWIFCTLLDLLFSSICFIVTITDKMQLIQYLLCFWVTTIVLTFFLYFYIQYLLQTGELYRRYRDELKKDFLTGLNNIRQFDSVYNTIIKKVIDHSDQNVSLIFIDIDYFKRINDTYGHTEGDTVLKEFSKVLMDNYKKKDLIFRKSGDEFVIISVNCTLSEVTDIAERIRAAVQANVFTLSNGKQIHITASFGVASYPDTTSTIDLLLEEADKALYRAKRSNRNKVAV